MLRLVNSHLLQALYGLLDVLFRVAVHPATSSGAGPRDSPIGHLFQGRQQLPGSDQPKQQPIHVGENEQPRNDEETRTGGQPREEETRAKTDGAQEK